MKEIYHNSAKKSIVITFLAIFLYAPIAAAARTPNDAFYASQKQIFEQINAPGAWDFTIGSRKTVIAMIDTGADIWHADLMANAWTNPYEIADNGRDDDANGYIDDIHGWNFVDDNNDVRTSVTEADEDPEAVRHGTIVAGIAGAVGDNAHGIAGMNWRAQIMPLVAVNSAGNGAFRDVVRAIDYAVANGASVISMSLIGEAEDETLRAALRRAYEAGVVVVAAAGNNRQFGEGNLAEYPVYPACFDSAYDNWILTVASLTAENQLSNFSNYGACVDIAAPGENVFSTERYAPVYNYLNEYGGGWNGTSFAVPFVAGTAGLIKTIHPEWSARQVINAIINNADILNLTNTGDGTPGKLRRLNAGRAVAIAAAEPEKKTTTERAYAFEKNAIYFTEGTSTLKYFIARVPDAKILSVVGADLNMDRRTEAVALINRGVFYYLRYIKSDGRFWKEYALPPEKNWTPVDLKVYENTNEEGRIAVRLYNSKTKETKFYEYNQHGEGLRSVTVRFTVQKWEIDNDNDILLYADKEQLTVKRIKWYNQ